ncbi:MAG TPA: DUF2652 domain-containing protein [Methylomirabilota bacterium]|jgi:hypothetical protein
MSEMTPATTGRAVLLIADIRGYTPFMKLHRTSLAHAQDIVGRLLEALIDAAPDLTPLEIEGDATFLYTWAREPEPLQAKTLLDDIAAMHRAFHACQERIDAVNTCRCDGCRQVGRLRVKFVAHVGDVAVQRVKQSSKLAGLDVILVHRMLKSPVPVEEYALLSEALFQAAPAVVQTRAGRLEQELEGLGKTVMYFLELADVRAAVAAGVQVSTVDHARENAGVIWRSLPYLLGVKRPRFAFAGRGGS